MPIETPPPSATQSTFMALVDLAFIGLVLLIAVCIGYLCYRFVKGVRSIEEEEEEALEHFVAETIELLQVPESQSFGVESPIIGAPDSPPTPVEAHPAGQHVRLDGLSSVAKRLQTLQLITSLEGKVPLALPPDGEIYGLKAVGSCLLLPRLEGEALMSHFARRFDLVLYLDGQGELIVLERFQHRLPSLLNPNTYKG